MLVQEQKTRLGTFSAALVSSVLGLKRAALAGKQAPAHGEKDLVKLLSEPGMLGRGANVSGRDREAVAALTEIRRRRRLSLRESEHLHDISRNRPQAEIQLYFAPGSSEVLPAAAPDLKRLGEALAHADLCGKTFLIAGHTCRQGGVEHSAELSIARAESVKRRLVENFEVDPDALLPHGYGFRYLKNPQKPFAQENHRFEIVNLSE